MFARVLCEILSNRKFMMDCRDDTMLPTTLMTVKHTSHYEWIQEISRTATFVHLEVLSKRMTGRFLDSLAWLVRAIICLTRMVATYCSAILSGSWMIEHQECPLKVIQRRVGLKATWKQGLRPCYNGNGSEWWRQDVILASFPCLQNSYLQCCSGQTEYFMMQVAAVRTVVYVQYVARTKDEHLPASSPLMGQGLADGENSFAAASISAAVSDWQR